MVLCEGVGKAWGGIRISVGLTDPLRLAGGAVCCCRGVLSPLSLELIYRVVFWG